jgi:hypothetical protein
MLSDYCSVEGALLVIGILADHTFIKILFMYPCRLLDLLQFCFLLFLLFSVSVDNVDVFFKVPFDVYQLFLYHRLHFRIQFRNASCSSSVHLPHDFV